MYATLEDLRARYGDDELIQISDLDGAADAIDAGRVERAISVATDQVESYLRKRYTVPLTTVPVSIVEAVCVLARHWLASNGRTMPTEQMNRERDAQLRWLRDLASGLTSLEGASEVKASPGAAARVSDRERRFEPGSGRIW